MAASTRRLADALEAWSSLPMDADLKFRVATNSLWLALLRQSNSDPETGTAFALARKAFAHTAEYDAAIARYLADAPLETMKGCYQYQD